MRDTIVGLQPVTEKRNPGSLPTLPCLFPILMDKGLRAQVAPGPTRDQALGHSQWKRRSNQSLRKGGVGGARVRRQDKSQSLVTRALCLAHPRLCPEPA